MVLWFGFLIHFNDDLENFFRVPCSAHNADWVRIFTPMEKAEDLTLFPGHVMQFVRWLIGKAATRGGSNPYVDVEIGNGEGNGKSAAPGTAQTTWRATTCQVQIAGSSGTKFFEYQCARFILRKNAAWDAKFSRPQIVIGPKFSEILSCAEGLDQRVANDRLDQIGPNTIPFKVDTLLEACSKEFFSYFYLYQLSIYTVWLWWSYLYVAACMVSLHE